MRELHDSIDYNNLKFEYVGPTKEVRFYEYRDSKELFNAIKNSQIEFSEVKNKQNEFLNTLSNIIIGKKTTEQKETIKTATGRGDDYTTGCLLDYIYFKNYCKIIAVDLSKQQALNADPKTIQKINFTAKLDRVGNTRFYFIIEEAKETAFEFSQGTVKVLSMQFFWIGSIVSFLSG